MIPPVLPIAPKDYDPIYQNQLVKILASYFNQLSAETDTTKNKSDVDEVLQWLE